MKYTLCICNRSIMQKCFRSLFKPEKKSLLFLWNIGHNVKYWKKVFGMAELWLFYWYICIFSNVQLAKSSFLLKLRGFTLAIYSWASFFVQGPWRKFRGHKVLCYLDIKYALLSESVVECTIPTCEQWTFQLCKLSGVESTTMGHFIVGTLPNSNRSEHFDGNHATLIYMIVLVSCINLSIFQRWKIQQ